MCRDGYVDGYNTEVGDVECFDGVETCTVESYGHGGEDIHRDSSHFIAIYRDLTGFVVIYRGFSQFYLIIAITTVNVLSIY